MIRAYKAEGIVLARRNVGEADKLVTVLTRQYGKKILKAAGIRRIHSRRSPHLELFAQVALVIHQGKTFGIISEVMPREHFSFIRQKLERVAFVYVALEIVNRILAENQEAPTIYAALLHFLQRLNQPALTRKEAREELAALKKYLLEELGFISKEGSQIPLDATIENILESRLKSPLLLTKIQSCV